MNAAPPVRDFVIFAVACIATGCAGYDDLPLPIREAGELRIERVERFVEGPGVVEVALVPPADADGPFVVVAHPAVVSGSARVIAWAFGPCAGGPAPTDAALRLCLAVQWSGADALTIATVVESRSDARRFTLSGSEAAP